MKTCKIFLPESGLSQYNVFQFLTFTCKSHDFFSSLQLNKISLCPGTTLLLSTHQMMDIYTTSMS